MQLTGGTALRLPASLFLVAASLHAAPALGDEVILRGNYWRDRNTRVVAPEMEFSKELPTGTIVGGGYLLDAITSASVAAGVLSDQPFTELRNQIGAHLGQRIGPVTVTGSYRYSTEGDYWSHTGGGTVAADLWKKNTTLAASYVYGHADAARRIGPGGFVPVGHLKSHFLILSGTQVLSRLALLDLSVELNRLGDEGDPKSFQANPYRTVKVCGTPQLEVVPGERNRLAATAGLRLAVPVKMGALRYLAAYFKLRYYRDDWSVTALSPEVRTYARLGPIELRFTGRYHTQTAASFYPHEPDGQPKINPEYTDKECSGINFKNRTNYTGDAKLSEFSSVFVEARVQFPLSFLDFRGMPLGRFLGEGQLALSYGHYANDRGAHLQFGDAEVAGLEMIFPL
ncbi:MAG: DUF3570 domain-containing protein [Myxococcales bacterium]|nr:DUF3570 domain-containing protein [Myxococcales bacterium]